MTIIMKKCEICGKTFPAIRNNQKYCGKACRLSSVEKRNEEIRRKKQERYGQGGQPCWRCQKACGKCSWSKFGIPVKCWEAIPTLVKSRGKVEFGSYKITYCPQFIGDA